jgi:HTH-type transcriptional regulator, sugar sensing transcriptional regulator
MITQKQLIELGFNQKEAKVYLALLELGPSTATEISRRAKINRTTSYDILDSLAGDGLVNLIGETKIQKYAAESPAKVIKFLENKITKTKEQLNLAQSLLPQLLSIYSVKEKPKVKFYEGTEGMKEGFEDTLTAKDEILAYAVGEDMYQALSKKYFQDYFKRRVAKNIHVRLIAPDTSESRAVAVNDIIELRTSLFVPKEQFYFSIEMNIYNNKIMIASWREKFAIIIESEEITSAQRKIFELAWLGAKAIQK